MIRALTAFAMLAGIWALGDVVAVWTRSYVSTTLTGITLIVAGLWTHLLPANIADEAGLGTVAGLFLALLVTHMGTLMDIPQTAQQWRTVVIALSSLLSLILVMLTVGRAVLGYEMAVASMPPIAGSLAAALIVVQRTSALGLNQVSVLVMLIFAIQGFVGIPLASYCLNREVAHLMRDPAFLESCRTVSSTRSTSGPGDGTVSKPKNSRHRFQRSPIPERYLTRTVLIFKVALVTLAGFLIGQYTSRFFIHSYIVCLALGVVCRHVGFLEENVLDRANALGLVLFVVLCLTPAAMSNATPALVLRSAWPLVASLGLGIAALGVGAVLAGKALGVRPEMSFAIALAALYAFPASYFMAREVSQARGRTPEERTALLDYLLPKVNVASFVLVTVSSIVLATVVEKIMV